MEAEVVAGREALKAGLVVMDGGFAGFWRIVDGSNAGESESYRYSSSGGVLNRPTCSTEDEPSVVCGVDGC